jgi:hypothetical protein
MLSAVAAMVAAAGTSTGAGSIDPIGWLITQGPLGLISAGLLFQLRKESQRADSERKRADAERAGKDLLVERFISDVVPALSASTDATRELLDVRRRDR